MATAPGTPMITLGITPSSIAAGGVATLTATVTLPAGGQAQGYTIKWDIYGKGRLDIDSKDPTKATWDTTGLAAGTSYTAEVQLVDQNNSVAAKAGITLAVTSAPTVVIKKANPSPITEGGVVVLEADPSDSVAVLASYNISIAWDAGNKGRLEMDSADPSKAKWNTTGLPVSLYDVKVKLVNSRGHVVDEVSKSIEVRPRPVSSQDVLPVALQRTFKQSTLDQALWVAIRNRTKAIAFSGSGYKSFIDAVLCNDAPSRSAILERQRNEYGKVALDPNSPRDYTTIVAGVGAYELLKTATEVFLLLNGGVAIMERDISSGDLLYKDTDEATRLGEVIPIGEITNRLSDYLGAPKQLPYLKRIIDAVFPGLEPNDKVHCPDILIKSRVDAPCLLELIWSYWHEEGMLAQTINAVSRRFQNLRSGSGHDPLAHLEIDPIRPLNNVLWGYIQDEQHRLTVQRRAYEYDHHYGLTLYGKAVPQLKSADSRSKFLEAYHNLLHLCTIFYSEDDDTTRIADAFPVLNTLKETHLLLAQGAHNQFGDLPWTARAEMLMQQWILARPEMRDFLQSRVMVPYQEGWMAQVDTMKKLQGWTDVTVTHFHDLGVYGEQILLAVRYGDWIGVNDPAQAANWARYWRPEIQSYIHAYRAVTGIDLTAEQVDYTMPATLLRNRLASQVRVR